jgi:predicted ATPase
LAGRTVDRLIHLGALFESSSGWRVTRLDRLERALSTALGDALNDQIDRLSSSDRSMLEAAAATGPEFTASQLAAGVGLSAGHANAMEQRLRNLAARHVLVDLAEGPGIRDASVTWFRFRHEMIPRLIVDRAPLERRLRLPRRHEASPTGR